MKARKYKIHPIEENIDDPIENNIVPSIEIKTEPPIEIIRLENDNKEERDNEEFETQNINENLLKLLEDIVEKSVNKRYSSVGYRKSKFDKLNEESLNIIEEKVKNTKLINKVSEVESENKQMSKMPIPKDWIYCGPKWKPKPEKPKKIYPGVKLVKPWICVK